VPTLVFVPFSHPAMSVCCQRVRRYMDTSNLLTPVSRTAPALRCGAFETAQLGGLAAVGALGTVTTLGKMVATVDRVVELVEVCALGTVITLGTIVLTVDSVVELVEDLFIVLFVDVVDLVLDVSETVLVEEKDVERVVLEEDLVILEVEDFCVFSKGSGMGMH
jgi:hypothetical protein